MEIRWHNPQHVPDAMTSRQGNGSASPQRPAPPLARQSGSYICISVIDNLWLLLAILGDKTTAVMPSRSDGSLELPKFDQNFRSLPAW
ncbi:hypothetical protein AAWM_04756 [Aspergillus awamori]|uniref:Uncharacterized protein n=1 Tax=Aspergillus awamori TaxID=105351 RepID=A0A401KRJ2_ASPAW|nr:hypothetical protein AAWM_04756 [Aspergillus awamori]